MMHFNKGCNQSSLLLLLARAYNVHVKLYFKASGNVMLNKTYAKIELNMTWIMQ